MNNEYGESMFQCAVHPYEEVVGVCASCLRERLYRLKGKNKSRRGSSLEIVYSSDSDSCFEFDEHKVHNFVPESYAIEKQDVIARRRFRWLTKSNKPRSSAQKKERTFPSLRSFFHRLRRNKEIKEETKPDSSTIHEDSFISIKLDGHERSQWVPPILPGLTRPCKTVGSSARTSVSELNRPSWDVSRPSWDGILSKRSSSYFEKDFLKKDIESYYSYEFPDPIRCSDYQQQDMMMTAPGPSYTLSDSSNAPVRWRTRMNALFQMRWRMQGSKASKIPNVVGGFKDPNNYPNQFPTSKIWSLSSLYNDTNNNNYHEPNANASTGRANKKSWIRSLKSPKWSLH